MTRHTEAKEKQESEASGKSIHDVLELPLQDAGGLSVMGRPRALYTCTPTEDRYFMARTVELRESSSFALKP